MTLFVAGAAVIVGLRVLPFRTQRSQIYFPVPATRPAGVEAVRLDNKYYKQ